MEKTSKLSFYPLVMVRAPRLDFSIAQQSLTMMDLISNRLFMEAIDVANPTIHLQINAFLNGDLTEKKKVDRLKSTLFNYFSRMSINPTPLGLFASVSSMQWGTLENAGKLNEYNIIAKLDTSVLEELMKVIRLNPSFKSEFKYVANNTIYRIGNKFRYVETLVKNEITSFNISSADTNEVIEEILTYAQSGKSVREIASRLGNLYQYSYGELQDFLFELVEAQILYPQFSYNISGSDPFSHLLHQFDELGLDNEEYKKCRLQLAEIEAILKKVQLNQITVKEAEKDLEHILATLQTPINGKTALRVDLHAELSKSEMPVAYQQNLLEAVSILGMFKSKFVIPRLEEFKKKFVERYEDAAIPLLEVLDSDLGISFGNFKFGNENSFYDERYAAVVDQNVVTSDLSRPFQLLQDKIIAAREDNDAVIYLKAEDFGNMNSGAEHLAATYQIFFGVLDTQEPLLYIDVAGNVSGGCLWSRFSMDRPEFAELLKVVAQSEQEYYKDAVVAEVIHIPEDRLGNLILRSHFRAYEIPILNTSTLRSENQIGLKDLFVTVKGQRIVLWSKTLNKEIIPRNTTVHNYNLRSTPIYQFLCELQYQDTIPSVSLDASDLPKKAIYTPRIQYKNIILSFASWSFLAEQITESIHTSLSGKPFFVDTFIQKWNLPEFCSYVDNNQITFLNWANEESVNMFIKHVKTVGQVLLREYPFNPANSLIVDQNHQPHVSKCVTVVFNNRKPAFNPVSPDKMLMVQSQILKSKFSVGDEWLYFKLYCGKYVAERLLIEEIWPLVNFLKDSGKISQFFYIQYNDPDYHLRLRFRTEIGGYGEIISLVRQKLNQYIDDRRIWKVQIDTYNREVGRYGVDLVEVSERIFEIDSFYQLKTLNLHSAGLKNSVPLLFIRSVIALIDGLQLSHDEKFKTIQSLKNGYEAEFKVSENKILQKYLNASELKLRNPLASLVLGDLDSFQSSLALLEFLNVTKEFEQQISLLSLNLNLNAQKNRLLSVLPSLIHMQAIRRFINSPRHNELFCYYALHAYFKKLNYTYATTIRNT
jgi:thiopeptide-type bacteriocin biosynthesis protein